MFLVNASMPLILTLCKKRNTFLKASIIKLIKYKNIVIFKVYSIVVVSDVLFPLIIPYMLLLIFYRPCDMIAFNSKLWKLLGYNLLFLDTLNSFLSTHVHIFSALFLGRWWKWSWLVYSVVTEKIMCDQKSSYCEIYWK